MTATHKILYHEEEDQNVVKTTHSKITYDILTEVFIIDLGEGSWCEVSGFNRFTKAVKLADLYYDIHT